MTKKELQQLLKRYDEAMDAFAPLCRGLSDIQAEARQFLLEVSRIAPQPYGDIYQRIDSVLKALPESTKRQELVDIKTRLSESRAKANKANAQLEPIVTELKSAVEAANSALLEQLVVRRSSMLQEVTQFLSAYCSTPTQARELAEQCDKIKAIDFQFANMRQVGDHRGRADYLLGSLK